MLSFFRSIRRSLLNEGKTWKYIKYAVGEFLLIVAGILVALQIQTWNENRKLEQERRELIDNLKADFQFNLERVEESLLTADSQMDTLKDFMSKATREDVIVSREEILAFLMAAYGQLDYRPLLGVYQAAVSDNSFKLLGSTRIRELFMEFEETNTSFQKSKDIAIENIFLHGAATIRKEVGSFCGLADGLLLPENERFATTPEKFQNIMKDREIYANCELIYILKRNRRNSLMLLRDINEQILAALEALD